MRFITITLIAHAPHLVTGEQKSTRERFLEVLGNARLAEELGFDGPFLAYSGRLAVWMFTFAQGR